MVRDWKRWLPLASNEGSLQDSRRMDLVLELPSRRGESSRKLDREVLAQLEAWPSLASHPLELLRKIEQLLKRINTETISWGAHYQCVSRATQLASPAIRKLFFEYCDQDSLPESHDRRESLTVAINACHQLSTAFMHHLYRDYHTPLKRYVDLRQRVLILALRSLEFVHLEQRLRALRYQKLPRTRWQNVNQLFFCFYSSGQTGDLISGLNCLGPELDPTVSGLTLKSPMTSLQQEYVAIQLLGLMDINTLSTRVFSAVDEIIQSCASKTDIVADDGLPLTAESLLVYYGQAASAYYTRPEHPRSVLPGEFRQQGKSRTTSTRHLTTAATCVEPALPASLKIDIRYLTSLLSGRQRELLSTLRADAPATAVDMSLIATMVTMNKHLLQRQRECEREFIIGKKVLQVYNGYMPVYKLLANQLLGKDDASPPEESFQLRDALAERSTLIDCNVKSAEFGQWMVMDANDGGIHIKTEETPYTTAMFIGQLLAFSYTWEGLRTPVLGFVTRLNRVVAGELEVIIQVLANHPEATAVQSDTLDDASQAFPGILLRDEVGEGKICRLALHQSHRLAVDARVKLEIDGQINACHLTAMPVLQREFIVYELQPDVTDQADLSAAGC